MSVTAKLLRDVTFAHCWPQLGGIKYPATFSAGTPVTRVPGPGGGWAIADENLVAQLTGNAHDARHRYVWVKEADVELS